MKKRIYSGQEVLEFALISGLVLIAAIGTVVLFGNKISGFFSGGPVTMMANHTPPIISASSESTDYSPVIPDGNSTGGESETNVVDDVEINHNSDGSVSFTVGGQNFHIPSNAMGMANDIFEQAEAIGAAGLEETIIQAYIQMIQQYQTEHPGEEVPAEWGFGNSMMSNTSIGQDVFGDAQINLLNMRVGDQAMVLVINYETSIENEDGTVITQELDPPSVYMVEGGYNTNITQEDLLSAWQGTNLNEGFFGEVTALNGEKSGQVVGQYLNPNYTPDNGLNIGDGNYLGYGDIYKNNEDDDSEYSKWLLDFSDANNKFDI